jgi:nicotinamidase-related amidase
MSKGNKAALLVIDVQQGLFERGIPIYRAKKVLENINTVIAGAREAGVPVIFIQHSNKDWLLYGSDAWQYHPDIQRLESETLIHKTHGDAFKDTELTAELEKLDAGKLVVCGLVTHGCVRATTLGALERDYETILVSDGHSSFSHKAAELIPQWNKKLNRKGAVLMRAKEVDFEGLAG